MASRGIEVWLAARRTARLATLVGDIEAAGGNAHVVALDVSDGKACNTHIAALDANVGGFDIVVANAGVGMFDVGILDADFPTIDRVLQTNLVGAVATVMAVLPAMARRGRGQIVGISSIAAEIPLPAGVPYGASKAALTFFLEGLRAEVGHRGVDVTIVHPGFVKTELTAKHRFHMPFLMEVEPAAHIIDRAIYQRARFVRFPWPVTVAMRLGRLVPARLRNALVRRQLPAAGPPPSIDA